MNATATMTPDAQHLVALQRANRVRLARADLKRRIADGSVSVAEVILDCPWEAESMSIADVLMSQRRWGSTRCRKFLAPFHISETKPLGALTQRQRNELVARIETGSRPLPLRELALVGA
jgi:hypothetical protein